MGSVPSCAYMYVSDPPLADTVVPRFQTVVLEPKQPGFSRWIHAAIGGGAPHPAYWRRGLCAPCRRRLPEALIGHSASLTDSEIQEPP